MSMPNIADINPCINIDKKKSVDLLVASIALEELGLSHIINCEAEKIQFVLGTLDKSIYQDTENSYGKNNNHKKAPTIEEILEINNSAESMMKKVIEEEILLQFKLEDAVKLSETNPKPRYKFDDNN